MNELTELLTDCDARGVGFLLAGDGGLTINAPKNALTPDLLRRLKTHKAELLAMLTTPEVAHSAPFVVSTGNNEPICEQPLAPDGWPVDCIDPNELIPCPKCGTLELWQTPLGNWRCLRCDSPSVAQRLAKLAERIRQQKSRKNTTGQ